MYEEAIAADAGLSTIAELRRNRPLNRQVDIGIVKDDEWCIAPKFKTELLDVVGGAFHQQRAYASRSGKRDLAHGFVGHQLIADFRRHASHDIDGWDAAVKVAALVTVLMGVRLRPGDVDREGIRGLTAEAVFTARAAGTPYKLVCHAKRITGGISATVGPEQVPLSDPLAWVAGTSSIVCFETDMFPGLIIREDNPGLDTTAYGMLADFMKAVSYKGSEQ